MAIGVVKKICITPVPRGEMLLPKGVMALKGKGLEGDRYAARKGSYNQPKPGVQDDVVLRQVTLMHSSVFRRLGIFTLEDTGRNLEVDGDFELMWLLSEQLRGRPADFEVGEALFRPVAYCDPCVVPNKRAQIPLGTASFKELYSECGGLIAEVIRGGWIELESPVITPKKNH
jgi:MOSC domain-containing protein YiiM